MLGLCHGDKTSVFVQIFSSHMTVKPRDRGGCGGKYLLLSVGVHAGKKIADPEICGENNEESHKDINMVKTR